MNAPRMELPRMFWRCEAGLLRREVVQRRLDDEINDLVHAYQSQRPLWQQFARQGSREIQICTQIEGSIDAARSALVANELRPAWRSLREAQHAWERLQSVVQANACLDQARSVRDRIEVAAGGGVQVSDFETFRVVTGLIARAESLFEAGEYRQARFVAAMCVSHVDSSPPANGSAVSAGIADRIARLGSLENRLVMEISWSGGGMPIANGVAIVAALDQAGHRALAEHILGDLEALVAPRAAFLAHLDRMRAREADAVDRSDAASPNATGQPDAAKRPHAHLIERSGIDAQDSWPAATEKLLHADLLRIAANIAAIDRGDGGPDIAKRNARS